MPDLVNDPAYQAATKEPEPTALEVIIATVKKWAAVLSDPRTVASVITVYGTFKMIALALGYADSKLSDKDITDLLQSSAALLVAFATFLTVVGSIVTIVVVWIRSWTERPSRGLSPWLKKVFPVDEPKTIVSTATISTTTVPPDDGAVG
jgi:hypothetical protein